MVPLTCRKEFDLNQEKMSSIPNFTTSQLMQTTLSPRYVRMPSIPLKETDGFAGIFVVIHSNWRSARVGNRSGFC